MRHEGSTATVVSPAVAEAAEATAKTAVTVF